MNSPVWLATSANCGIGHGRWSNGLRSSVAIQATWAAVSLGSPLLGQWAERQRSVEVLLPFGSVDVPLPLPVLTPVGAGARRIYCVWVEHEDLDDQVSAGGCRHVAGLSR